MSPRVVPVGGVLQIEISKAAVNAFARLSHALGKRLSFTINGLGDDGTSFVFGEDGSYLGRDNSESGDWQDLDPIAAVDATLWKECETRFAAFTGELALDEEESDSELDRGFVDVWIDIATEDGHFIINAQSGQIMREE